MKRNSYFIPVLIAVFICIYYIGLIASFLLITGIAWWIRILLSLLPAALGAVVIYVLVQRIKEIKSGESDDLNKY